MNLISWNVKCKREMAVLAAETEIPVSDTHQSPSSGLTPPFEYQRENLNALCVYSL